MSRYQGATARTTAKCEWCGSRVPVTALWYPDPQDPIDLADGVPFTFRFNHWGLVEIGRVLNTVCSEACDRLVTRKKIPWIQAEVEARQRAVPLLQGTPANKRTLREGWRYASRIRKAVEGGAYAGT